MAFEDRYWALMNRTDFLGDHHPFIEMPDEWGCVGLDAWAALLVRPELTIKMVAVLMAMLREMASYENRVSESCQGIANKAKVARSTVIRSVRLFEEWGVLEKTSKPRASSEWSVNPVYCCKAFPKKELIHV